MIKILIISGLMASSVMAYGVKVGNTWEIAYKVDSQRINMSYNRCVYESRGSFLDGDYKFSINIQGTCPFSVQYNLGTGEWKEGF